jgi:hypothetical protein
MTAWVAQGCLRPYASTQRSSPELHGDKPQTEAAIQWATAAPAAVWDKYPELAKRHEGALKKMREWLTGLEPDAFAASYPGIARRVNSPDKKDRLRALRASGALREMAAIPILAQRMGSADHVEALEATVQLANWASDEYRACGRRTPERLGPLLPLFIEALLAAKGEPNISGFCCQAIGCLAGPEWLPWLVDVSRSRQDAVTHWAAWAVQELNWKAGH